MSDPQPQPAKQKQLAPGWKVRLAWWFGIYFAAQVPLAFIIHDRQQCPLFSSMVFLSILNFPTGLGFFVSGFLPYWLAPYLGGKKFDLLFSAIWNFPYLLYPAHLLAVLGIRSRWGLRILLAVLVVFLVLNFVGCQSMIPYPDGPDGP